MVHLVPQVISSFIHFLIFKFAAFNDCMIDHFVLSPHNLYLLFCCVLFILALTDWSLWRCFELLLEENQFLSYGFPFLAISMFSRLKFHLFVTWSVHLVFFFPFLFSGYFHSISPRVVNIVFGGSNQSSSTFFCVVFESYRCVNHVIGAGKYSSSFFSWLIKYTNVISEI